MLSALWSHQSHTMVSLCLCRKMDFSAPCFPSSGSVSLGELEAASGRIILKVWKPLLVWKIHDKTWQKMLDCIPRRFLAWRFHNIGQTLYVLPFKYSQITRGVADSVTHFCSVIQASCCSSWEYLFVRRKLAITHFPLSNPHREKNCNPLSSKKPRKSEKKKEGMINLLEENCHITVTIYKSINPINEGTPSEGEVCSYHFMCIFY